MNKPKRHVADIDGTTVTAIQHPRLESRKLFQERVSSLYNLLVPLQPTEPTP